MLCCRLISVIVLSKCNRITKLSSLLQAILLLPVCLSGKSISSFTFLFKFPAFALCDLGSLEQSCKWLWDGLWPKAWNSACWWKVFVFICTYIINLRLSIAIQGDNTSNVPGTLGREDGLGEYLKNFLQVIGTYLYL